MNYNSTTNAAQLVSSDGTVIQEIVIDPYATEVIHVGISGEVAGCTDLNACNYNPEATCEDGSCYLCFGCTDPTALNYDATAWLEDGSCMYEMVPPIMGMMMLPDSAQNQFYVLANIMGLGNMPPYLLRNDYNNDETLVNETGQMMFGPFPCDASVEFTISSLEGNLMNALQTTFDADCNSTLQVQNTQKTSPLTVYPNPTAGEIQILHDLQQPALMIYDLAGKCVYTKNQYSSATSISLESLSPGIYEVVLLSGVQRVHTRLVIQ
jgi:hypothetical protein